MVEWHHRLDGHEFEQAPGVGDGQGEKTVSLINDAGKNRQLPTTHKLKMDWTSLVAYW